MDEKLKDVMITEKELESVYGGVKDSTSWIYDPGSPIKVLFRVCPDCQIEMPNTPLTYPSRGYDVFTCKACQQHYLRTYIGDQWYRAYEG